MSNVRWSHPYRSLPEERFWQSVVPTPLENPRWVDWNPSVSKLLGVDQLASRADSLAAFAAGTPLPEWQPLAQVYSGHQFGQWAGQLGDGRGLYLGQTTHNGIHREWHLKGAGMTPYSRMGDGRAVLRSSIREYLIGDYMHGLGVPTTRALALVDSDTSVRRETWERGATLCRIAHSHLRIGHLEHFYYRNEHDALRTMLDFSINQLDPDLPDSPARPVLFFERVLTRSAALVAAWMAVGFVHGVMNTDNTALSGETLDYGPYGFISHWDPEFVINHTDHTGRYAYGQQPSVMYWNMARLAETLTPFVEIDELKALLDTFPALYRSAYGVEMAARLAIDPSHPDLDAWVSDAQTLFGQPGRYYSELFHWALHDQEVFLSSLTPSDPVARDLHQRWQGMYESSRLETARERAPAWMLSHWLLDTLIKRAEQGETEWVSAMRGAIEQGISKRSEAASELGGHPPAPTEAFHLSCSS